jgi:alkanesulfonate monooxygenase SsuD/methylene tetrahydromethanopterin reductase-like flavin-dependent oxidoreductase (luciferase family)
MLVLPLFHPLHVAQQAALLDVLSSSPSSAPGRACGLAAARRPPSSGSPGWPTRLWEIAGWHPRISQRRSSPRKPGLFRQALAAHGKPLPSDFPALRTIVVAPDRRTALREAGPYLEASYRLFGQWGLFKDVVGSGKNQLDLPELLAGRIVIGAPEQCAAELVRVVRAGGFTHLVCRMQWMGMEQRISPADARAPSGARSAAATARIGLRGQRPR